MRLPNELKYNNNPGIEYEIACLYNLTINKKDKSNILNCIINNHSKSADIKEIIYKLNRPMSCIDWKNSSGNIYDDLEIVTQDDNVGPADIILNYSGEKVGISIKYNNKCNINITGRDFLPDDKINTLKSIIPNKINNCVRESAESYGHPNKWFRKRIKSTSTDEIIDIIRKEVISEWDIKSENEKKTIINKLFHNESPIPFWVLEIRDTRQGFCVMLNKTPPHYDDVSNLKLEIHETSFIMFKYNNTKIGKMQVKFNNGILEKAGKKSYDIEEQGVKMKYGNPFSSWNFSIL